MRHKPRALIGDAQHPVKLLGAHAFLAGTKQMERHEPLVQWNMAVLEDRSNSYAELLPAGSTIKQAAPRMGFSAIFSREPSRRHRSRRNGAKRAIGPAFRFQVLTRFVVILKVGLK